MHNSIGLICFSASLIGFTSACISGRADYAEPSTCRMFPDQCLSMACEKLKRHYHIDCNDPGVRSRVRDALTRCTDYDTCFNDIWREDVTPANCRSRPDSCMGYACYTARSLNRGGTCDNNDFRQAVRRKLQNCHAPKVDLCLKGIPVTQQIYYNSGSNSFESQITPANCRSDPNSCLEYACNRAAQNSNNGGNCKSYDFREAVKRRLRECHAPRIDLCLNNIQTSNSQRNVANVISPSICRNNVESCMPYACDKVRKDYGRNCNNNGRFRNELRNLVQNCNQVSVDLCLSDVPVLIP